MAARVIHFEIPARDPERANAFYSGVFGWDVRKWEGPEDYWLLTTGPDEEPGINGAIMPQMDHSATPRVVVRVDSVDEATARVQNRGGRIAAPKMPIPGLGWFAYAEDPRRQPVRIIPARFGRKLTQLARVRRFGLASCWPLLTAP